MKRLILLLIVATISIGATDKVIDLNLTDDWEYNSSEPMRRTPLFSNNRSRGISLNKANFSKSVQSNIGLSVGGAKDTNSFKENIKNGYLPQIESITYEGQFYNHYFDTGLNNRECKELFCPSYSSAKRLNPFSKEKEYFLSVGLNSGVKMADFKRKKLNLVVVLDISGSMGSSFSSYYYSKNRDKISEKDKKTKIKIATESIVAMLSHLKDDDRLGIVLFDNRAYIAKPLRVMRLTDRDAINRHILELKEQGGTDWSIGYREAIKLFEGVNRDQEYENRVVFLTDAMPNRGELKKDRLFGLAKKATKDGIHTTFIGVGVDFNADLVEYVSKTKGANYFSVHSSKEFKKLLDNEFEYMVTPLVYDLELKLDSKKYKIEAVYGSPNAKISTGEIMKVNTLFPSSNKDGETKGGIVLLKLKKIKDGDSDIKLEVSYKNINGTSFSNQQLVEFKKDSLYYDNSGIRKAILISDFVTIMKRWIKDSRGSCADNNVGFLRKVCKLKVEDRYKKIFNTLKVNFEKEIEELKDDSLKLELNILKSLIEHKGRDSKDKNIDDWQFKQ